MIPPLELSIESACPATHAFETWTTRISTWWPSDHTVSGDPVATVVLEPRLGGRIYERTPDGREGHPVDLTVDAAGRASGPVRREWR